MGVIVTESGEVLLTLSETDVCFRQLGESSKDCVNGLTEVLSVMTS